MSGQYYQPPPPGYGPQPHQMEPPEAGSIKSMLNITGILCLIAGIILLLVGIVWIILLGIIGGINLFGFIGLFIGPILIEIFLTLLEIYSQSTVSVARAKREE